MGTLRDISLQQSFIFDTYDSDVQETQGANGLTPETVLKDVFGYDSFRPLQKEIIQNVLDGRDTLAVMPTGGGKSLCYEIPALIMTGLTVVVSPLIALMQDQVAQLEAAGVQAVCLNSSMSQEAYADTCQKIRSGTIKLLYVSPEGLNTRRIQSLLADKSVSVDCITIDEAHCVSEWGHDFRPDYLALAAVRKQFPRAVCLALTATATRLVRDDIILQLKLENPAVLVSSFDRPNIFLEVKPKIKPLSQVTAFLRSREGESGIIYCFSRKQVDELTDELVSAGFSAQGYHAGLGAEERAQHQKAFINGRVDIMVATVAFGMGINKPDVRFVIHYDMPKSIEQYYQEIGRAGRDGLPSHALLLYSPGDIRKIKFFFKDQEDPTQAERLLSGMIHYALSKTCRRETLLSYFGEQYGNRQHSQNRHNASLCCCDICSEARAVKPLPESTQTIKPLQKPKKASTRVNSGDSQETRIAAALKAWRRKKADEENLPPYVIFGDRTMLDIAAKKPRTKTELLQCYGIGERKAEIFGRTILAIVKEYGTD